MKKNISILILLLTSLSAFSSDPKFPVSEIPDELKKDVNVIVREDKMIYKIIAQNRASTYCYYAVTILNENGKDYAESVIPFDKGSKIKDINAFAYDANGKLIKKIRNKDIYEQSAFDGFSLYSDNRFKSIDLRQNMYPYTVEFEFEIEYYSLYDFHGSRIVPDEKVSVQKFFYQIIYPKDLSPRYKVLNMEDKHEIATLPDGNESISWSYTNIKPVILEPLGPHPGSIFPRILAAPSRFENGGYVGDMSTWEAFGRWNLLLNKGRDVLPEATKQKVKALTKNLSTTEEKAKALYQFLQSKTRYVSIQLGIGGLQPFEASVVDQTGYGDCKALSNYMVAMLKEVGIKAYYATVYGGTSPPPLIADFPSHQANHVIVALPNEADTLWLECTDQTNPFGYQGRFTGDRKALLITEEGGKLVNTTQYRAGDNIQSRTVDVFVEGNGNAKAKAKTTYSGLRYENDRLDFTLDNQFDDQKKWIQRNTGIPSFDINSFSMKNIKARIPSAIVSIDLNLNRLATVSGKRMFLVANLMNRSTYIPEKVENRKTNVVLRMAFTDLDTIKYHLPEELYPEYLPEPVKITSRFGSYEASYKLEQGSLIYIRKIKRLKGEFPPESYAELIDFYKRINKADHVKIVFLNKT